ncbi:MAG: carbohydrate ABC transporter permease [Anaerolineae bacterium]|nr:carbohydrate ABC transporter permease [Anaerolineae bacterium]MDW8100561.1 carbohydrate ABC transporter permease [Anaerolineae bacterium]
MNAQAIVMRARPRPLARQIEKWALWLLLGIGTIAMVAPFYWMIITSFKPKEEVMVFPPTWWPHQPTLRPWVELTKLRGGGFPVFFRNSLFVTVSTTILVLLTSSMAGYVFAKFRFRGRDALFLLVLSMMMIPFNVSIIPLYALMVDLKWTNSYWALIIPSAFSPFGIFLMRQFMHSIPNDLIDAGRIDGASEFAIFFRIVMPLSTAALGALGIFTFMWNWDDFLWPLVIIDEPRLYTLPLGLSQLRGRFGTDVASMTAGATVAVLPVLIVYLFAQRRFIEGIALTGLKG